MEHSEIELEADQAQLVARPRKLRWVLRGMLGMCGVMMVLVLLSEPRVVAQVQASADRLTELFSGGGDVALLSGEMNDAAPARAVDVPAYTATEPRAKPLVSSMPTSRIPVRRGALSNGG